MKPQQLTLLLPLIPAAISCGAQEMPKPVNIIYIMTDDHSYQTVSAYDTRYIKTPNIDRIAAQGVLFENSFVANSISGPSRACLLTGKHSHINGFTDNTKRFDTTQMTVARLLKEGGYQTAMIGKWHLGGHPSTDFDYWRVVPGQGNYYNPDFITPEGNIVVEGYATDIITDMGIDYLSSVRDKEKPFMLFLHHKAPHRNWMGNTPDLDAFEDVTFPIPDNYYDDYRGREAARVNEMSIIKDMVVASDLKMVHEQIPDKYGAARSEIRRMNPAQRAAWEAQYNPITEKFLKDNLQGNELAEWKFQRYMRDYLKCIKSVDDNIGRLMAYLEREGLLENTLVIYTSDQGFYMGEHGWFDKRFIYEESLRTPLVARMPNSMKDAPRGVKVSEMVQNIDHAPMFLAMAGLEIPAEIQGVSYKSLLEGKHPANWRKSIYYHYYEHPGEHNVHRHYGVRSADNFTLVHFYSGTMDTWELYDMNKDKAQMHNVYGKPEYAAKQAELHTELDRLREQYKATE